MSKKRNLFLTSVAFGGLVSSLCVLVAQYDIKRPNFMRFYASLCGAWILVQIILKIRNIIKVKYENYNVKQGRTGENDKIR